MVGQRSAILGGLVPGGTGAELGVGAAFWLRLSWPVSKS